MIHKYKMHGSNMVVDVNSGSLFVFDDISFDILDYYNEYSNEDIVKKLSNKYDKEDIEEALNEIDELKSKELLYSEDPYENYVPSFETEPVIKALCLHISHDCNLRCKYCFASTGNFGGTVQ